MTTEQPTTLTKSRLMRALEKLPDDASREEILDCVVFVIEVERALEELDAGAPTISHEEALARIHQWLK